MDIQTFYPVFETGQVLTSELLNDIIEYLEPQDRTTRANLTGIGVIGGLRPDWNATAGTLALSRGVAVTSAGHLIVEDHTLFDRVRPYSVPIPSGPTATAEDKAKARYPFLFDGNTQREAFELLPTDFQPAPGEAAPTLLTAAFVADKTLLLFLETNLESLKNCNVNDCSDKGSEMNLTLRRLLVSRSIADTILSQEQAIAGRPVDRANHPRLSLPRLAMDKINPAGTSLVDLADLHGRYLACIVKVAGQLMPAMNAAWNAYRPLLQDLYPDARFPDGPIPRHHLLNMVAALVETPVLVQYLYAGMHDLLLGYNEFVECAALFDAECAPNPARFPKHLLAGDVEPRPLAFAGAPKTLADYAQYDALTAKGGAAPEGAPARRRHHFVPSPAVDCGDDRAAELRALFCRMVLIAQTYATRNLLGADIELTPSRDGAAPLGERAIPFYYRFDAGSDLFVNWSWRKARTNRFDAIHSWQFSASANPHPLLLRQDEQDFIRIEGVLGKPLGSTMAELIREKRRLGLSFSLQPVWVALSDDPRQNDAARQRALAAIQQLLVCRMRDLDVIFLTIMAAIFAFMVWLVQVLGRLDATKATKRTPSVTAPSPATGAVGGRVLNANLAVLNLEPQEQRKVRLISDQVLSTARNQKIFANDTVKVLAQSAVAEQPLQTVAVASVYDKVRDKAIGGELFERVRAASDTLGVAGDKEELSKAIYPAVALMARAEDMMKVASADSLADFDDEAFDTALRGFTDAYVNYAAQAETDPAKTGVEIANANLAIVGKRDMVSAAATQTSSATITQELAKRLKSMFEEMTFAGFARKHPGLEHKGGTPVGGTFVLLYAGRDELDGGMRIALEKLRGGLGDVFAKLLKLNAPDLSAQASIKQLLASSKPRSDDQLDDFVVLGDFCLPYLCCDSDCSDTVVDRRINQGVGTLKANLANRAVLVAQPARDTPVTPAPVSDGPASGPTPAPAPTPTPAPTEPVEPRPSTGKVEISVVSGDARRGVPLQGATLVITDLATGQAKQQRMATATLSLELKAGKYAFVASSGTLSSAPVEIGLKAGATVAVTLQIVG
ncbi:hypothetical protein [Pseudomonas fluorescens]|uniref:hypothetical protein n=1 Tax=Pseudomonas fluorescens TaxID=294 RepID=UPI00123EFA94|nr:hypothetical protein [Pseudomonas fluorescens]VVN49414.1 hypothetical protein PS639_06368 [Pseudomonas fluorescens]